MQNRAITATLIGIQTRKRRFEIAPLIKCGNDGMEVLLLEFRGASEPHGMVRKQHGAPVNYGFVRGGCIDLDQQQGDGKGFDLGQSFDRLALYLRLN